MKLLEARKMVVRGVVRAHQQTVEDEVRAIDDGRATPGVDATECQYVN